MIRRLRRLVLVAAAARALLAQSGVTVTPQQLSLASPLGSTASVTQTVTVVASGQNTAFSTSVRYLTPSTGWLSVNPASGTAPATVTVSANPANLKEGSHLAQVLVRAGIYETYADVLYVVGSAAAESSLSASPSGLTFVADSPTNDIPAQSITVSRMPGSVTGSLGFQIIASSTGNWLSVYPWSASTPAAVTVVANAFGLAPGRYNGTVALIPQTGNPRVIPVTLLVLGATPVPDAITLDQTSVTINYQTGTSIDDLPLQGVGVTTSPSPRQYTVATATTWLKVLSAEHPSPGSSLDGTSPGAFSIAADPTGLSPGTYLGTIVVTSQGLPQQELPVTLKIAVGAALNADPSSLIFDDQGNIVSIISLTATGGANLAFTATVAPGAPWLEVLPASGSTQGTAVGLQISAAVSGLAPGTYNGNVVVTPSGGSAGNLLIPVRLKISSNAGSGNLVPETSYVSLSGIVGGPNPSSTLAIGASVAGLTHDFSASAASTGGWLTVEPFRGAAPGSITLKANLAAVPRPGVNNANVDLVSLLTGVKQTIAVDLTLSVQAISVSPQSLAFVQNQYGIAPAPQTIRVTANLAGAFTVTSAPAWAKVNPSSGNTPADLVVSVDSKSLPPGPNAGVIVIKGPSNQVQVPISFQVAEAPGPTVTPDSVQMSYQLGAPAPDPQLLIIGSNTGQPGVGFTATPATASGVNWLNVSPVGGVSPSSVAVTLFPGSLTPGSHIGTITIASTDRLVQRTVPVNLNVTASSIGTMAVLHGASFAPTPAAPGLLVTITGSGLGPEVGVSAKPTAAGAIDTQLAGTQVFFDGVPAPLLYVRQDQINAIVPYAVYGRANVKVQVQRGTDYAVPIDLKVADSAPGIFTSSVNGRGQAAALNGDMTPNSAANPAPRGGVISIYMTGEGQTDPPGQDGRIILTDLRRPLLTVSATIGGQTAEVLYAGSAPAIVSGVAQINLKIPESIGTGPVPVVIQIGSATSQPGVTIAVR